MTSSMVLIGLLGIMLPTFLLLCSYLIMKKKNPKFVNQIGKSNKKKNKVKFLDECKRLGIPIGPTQFFIGWVVIIFCSVGLAFLMTNPFLIVIVIASAVLTSKILLMQVERKIRTKAKNMLGTSLLNLGSAYKTLGNWLEALKTVIPLTDEPLKKEFIRVKDDHESGMPIGECFKGMAERLNVPELTLFITMVEISEEIGTEAAEGISVSGAYFQTLRLAAEDIANAMLNALSSNRMLLGGFLIVILYFRIFQTDMFEGYMNTFMGNVLLTFYISIAVGAVIGAFYIVRKEV